MAYSIIMQHSNGKEIFPEVSPETVPSGWKTITARFGQRALRDVNVADLGGLSEETCTARQESKAQRRLRNQFLLRGERGFVVVRSPEAPSFPILTPDVNE